MKKFSKKEILDVYKRQEQQSVLQLRKQQKKQLLRKKMKQNKKTNIPDRYACLGYLSLQRGEIKWKNGQSQQRDVYKRQDLIMPKFQKFAESRNQDNYYVRGTFTHHNLDFSKDVLHLADLGFKQISVEPVVAPVSYTHLRVCMSSRNISINSS